MARVSKVDARNKKEDGGRPHREHRSKKGRSYKSDYWKVVTFKRKKQQQKEKELDNKLSTLTL